jgi:hypothetical protein
MGSVAQKAPLCSRCKKAAPAEGDAGLCVECREYKRDHEKNYRNGEVIRESAKSFREGAEAMRELLLSGLRKAHPAGMFQNHEVVKWIAETEAPELKDRTQSST